MQPRISATVVRPSGRLGSASFLAKASALLAQATEARSRGAWADALEYAYRAGLRVAGARLADSPPTRRRRPGGAFERLGRLGPVEAQWAQRLARYSRVRARLNSGLDTAVDTRVVDGLIGLVEEFLASVEEGEAQLSAA